MEELAASDRRADEQFADRANHTDAERCEKEIAWGKRSVCRRLRHLSLLMLVQQSPALSDTSRVLSLFLNLGTPFARSCLVFSFLAQSRREVLARSFLQNTTERQYRLLVQGSGSRGFSEAGGGEPPDVSEVEDTGCV